jgi:glycerol-3-phosphate acyltransferase PlsY
MELLGWVLGLALCYLLGSIPFGYLIGRLGGIDIRRWGSKNVGATNVARILGWRRGVIVLVLDALKGAGAVGLIGHGFARMIPPEHHTLFLVLCGAAVVVGHSFPCWLAFKGGKGVATALGAWLVLAWLPTLIALAAWAIVVAIWRYVSLASIVAAVVLPGVLVASKWPNLKAETPLVVFAGLLSLLVILKHIGNIVRIARGTESRIENLFAKSVRAPKPRNP